MLFQDTPKKDEKPAANQAGAAAGKKEELKLSKKGKVFCYNGYKCYTAVFIMTVLIFSVRFVSKCPTPKCPKVKGARQGAKKNVLLYQTKRY